MLSLRARRYAVHVGLLDHCRKRLLTQPTRLQKTREVAALAQLGSAQPNRPGAGLPQSVAGSGCTGPARVLLADPLYRNFNNISVRSFILTGAPIFSGQWTDQYSLFSLHQSAAFGNPAYATSLSSISS